ncbi:MAG: heme ABC transporter ATP-binding protein [Armatimonadota bacterium]
MPFKIDHLYVSFDSTPVLSDVSFAVHPGEFLGIIGPNGSGKSTLLRAMAGVLAPNAGSITLDGADVASVRDRARRLAVVPQESVVAFDYTVREIVLMGRAPHLSRFAAESPRDVEIAEEAMRRANLTHLASRRAGELSGGERQRVMVARALAQDTEIVFLDEPTAHLDINYQLEILCLARRENVDRGRTVVVVLHDLNLASEFCDRLVMLSGGRLYAAGSPEEVITAESVRKVYGTSVWVRKHPTSGKPYILSAYAPVQPFTVHVICGGGSGGAAFAELLTVGCGVTAGVINIGDADQAAAEHLGIEYVDDLPFAPISEAAEKANAEFIARADAVVVTDAPYGCGNLANLRAAVCAQEAGKPVAVLGRVSGRDFADGEAEALLSVLAERGDTFASADELPAWVAKRRGV